MERETTGASALVLWHQDRRLLAVLSVGIVAAVLFAAISPGRTFEYQYDAYADSVHDFTGIGLSNPQNAVGAPDGSYVGLAASGGTITLGMGRGADGTGDLLMHVGPIAVAAQTRIAFLDEDMRFIKQVNQTLTISLVNPQTYTIAFDAEAEDATYRYVRISTTAALGFNLDSIEADTYLGSSSTFDSDGDGIPDREENENGTNPFDPLDPTPQPQISISAPTESATVSGNAVSVTASATSSSNVHYVQFWADGINIGEADLAAPWSAVWDTTLVANGTHEIFAEIEDDVGRVYSNIVHVTVAN